MRSLGLAVFTQSGDEGHQSQGGEEHQDAGGGERQNLGGGDSALGQEPPGGRKGRKGETEESIFVLSESLPVVPAKLVRRILRAEYIDMAELLKDNMEAERRRMQADSGGAQTQFAGRQARRAIPDILSWLQCFGLYAAVVTSHYPEKSRELLAYQTMLIAESRRCGGRGWLLYDTAFRQQIVSFDTVNFAKINQSLYASLWRGEAEILPRLHDVRPLVRGVCPTPK